MGDVLLQPWSEADLPLLQKLLGDPDMMVHLGGPEHARQEPKYQFMHAFPSVENPASNAICRKLGFTLVEECQFEYPREIPCSVTIGVLICSRSKGLKSRRVSDDRQQ